MPALLLGSPRPRRRSPTHSTGGRFASDFRAGQELDRDDAIRLALRRASPVSGKAADADAVPLGQREAEVARRVAEGRSNKAIGSRLFISERTVESHVRNILAKLGFTSRAQVAAWMAGPDG